MGLHHGSIARDRYGFFAHLKLDFQALIRADIHLQVGELIWRKAEILRRERIIAGRQQVKAKAANGVSEGVAFEAGIGLRDLDSSTGGARAGGIEDGAA